MVEISKKVTKVFWCKMVLKFIYKNTWELIVEFVKIHMKNNLEYNKSNLTYKECIIIIIPHVTLVVFANALDIYNLKWKLDI